MFVGLSLAVPGIVVGSLLGLTFSLEHLWISIVPSLDFRRNLLDGYWMLTGFSLRTCGILLFSLDLLRMFIRSSMDIPWMSPGYSLDVRSFWGDEGTAETSERPPRLVTSRTHYLNSN